MTYSEKDTEKHDQSISKLWINFKLSNICITGVSESAAVGRRGETKKLGKKKYQNTPTFDKN